MVPTQSSQPRHCPLVVDQDYRVLRSDKTRHSNRVRPCKLEDTFDTQFSILRLISLSIISFAGSVVYMKRSLVMAVRSYRGLEDQERTSSRVLPCLQNRCMRIHVIHASQSWFGKQKSTSGLTHEAPSLFLQGASRVLALC